MRENQATAASTSTVVARVRTDAATAACIQDGLAGSAAAEAAAIAITEEPDGHWLLAAHFATEPDKGAVRALIASLGGEALAAELVFETLPPTDWVRKSLEGLQPVQAGRFVVHGRHDRQRIGRNRIAVQIEATLAFGTGHHASTRGCLIALDCIMKRRAGRARRPASSTAARKRPSRKAAVLDIGTGSGVLAIAAAKAMRVPVLASDIDARAAAVAREHARVNGVAANVEIAEAAGVVGRFFRRRSPFALIFANILLAPLRQLATPIRTLIAPGGAVVLSGLLNAQAGPAIASYNARGFALIRRIRLGGWTTLIVARPPRAPRRPTAPGARLGTPFMRS
ncbi:MAG TPA: 50S ribosomal protein L11 methyltransferase [Xanthobacteraceae bacterium]|jgi:ribosomal protein L11 methyltransferase